MLVDRGDHRGRFQSDVPLFPIGRPLYVDTVNLPTRAGPRHEACEGEVAPHRFRAENRLGSLHRLDLPAVPRDSPVRARLDRSDVLYALILRETYDALSARRAAGIVARATCEREDRQSQE